jgi:hypothetical protein
MQLPLDSDFSNSATLSWIRILIRWHPKIFALAGLDPGSKYISDLDFSPHLRPILLNVLDGIRVFSVAWFGEKFYVAVIYFSWKKIQYTNICTYMFEQCKREKVPLCCFIERKNFLTLLIDRPCSSLSRMCRASPLMGRCFAHCLRIAGWAGDRGFGSQERGFQHMCTFLPLLQYRHQSPVNMATLVRYTLFDWTMDPGKWTSVYAMYTWALS